MKKMMISLAIASTLLVSAVAAAADCDPAKLNQSIMENVTKLQQSPEKFVTIQDALTEYSTKVPALQAAGDVDGLCKELTKFEAAIAEAAK